MEAQRTALGASDKEFRDEGVSGGVLAADRPGWSALMSYVREGDTVAVYAVDRLGRDAIDVQATVRALLARGVAVDVLGLGVIAHGVGELILAVLAQVADMERKRSPSGAKLAGWWHVRPWQRLARRTGAPGAWDGLWSWTTR